ncbi:hypothetical protein [Psychrobacillus sp. NPDC096389]|uniref:hypothetical protein n=1 Tax=Psychrobacillus sp. NPDC096389 TaxID=3364490 RepID=UPI00381D41F4
MNEEQKAKLNEIVEILGEKVPREVLLKEIEKISNMNEKQLEGFMYIMELFNRYDVDINVFEEAADQKIK